MGRCAVAHYDFNGDGYNDLYYCTSSTTCFVELGSASGFGAAVWAPANGLMGDLLGTGVAGILAPNGSTWYYYTWNGNGFSGQSTALGVDSTAAQFALVDIDGDGRPDLVTFYSSNGVSATTRLNTSTSSMPYFSSNAVAALSDLDVTWDGVFTPDNQGGATKVLTSTGMGCRISCCERALAQTTTWGVVKNTSPPTTH